MVSETTRHKNGQSSDLKLVHRGSECVLRASGLWLL